VDAKLDEVLVGAGELAVFLGLATMLVKLDFEPFEDLSSGEVRIPIQSGQAFRFDVGRRSDLMSATIPK
jgi:hypothetical protein